MQKLIEEMKTACRNYYFTGESKYAQLCLKYYSKYEEIEGKLSLGEILRNVKGSKEFLQYQVN